MHATSFIGRTVLLGGFGPGGGLRSGGKLEAAFLVGKILSCIAGPVPEFCCAVVGEMGNAKCNEVWLPLGTRQGIFQEDVRVEAGLDDIAISDAFTLSRALSLQLFLLQFQMFDLFSQFFNRTAFQPAFLQLHCQEQL